MNINFRTCLKHLGRDVRGVIHIGTNLGEQCRTYSDNKVSYVLWLDRNKTNLSKLYEQTKKFPLKQQYVTELFLEKDVYKVSRSFDNYLRENLATIPVEKYDMLVVDVEDGSEFQVLAGFEGQLCRPFIKHVHTNVRGLNDMDEYLKKFGFKQCVNSVSDIGHGSALYSKEAL